jgi:hypothetical protein
MTLPEVCPLDEKQKCKGRECHLFCLEWRTREPTCLIGYSTTSKVKSWKDDRKQDTYAEETYRKLSRQSAPRKKSVSANGDWIPSRLKEQPQDKPVNLREDRAVQKTVSEKPTFSNPTAIPEKAFTRFGAHLKKEPTAEEPIIYGRNQSKVQEKAKVPEKVISSNKHTTIFTSIDKAEKKESYPSESEEKTKRSPDDKVKRKRIDEVMEIDTPEVYDEEFWS